METYNPLTLEFLKSGTKQWTSRNNRYTITHEGRANYVVRDDMGRPVGSPAKSFIKACAVAQLDQNGQH